MTALDLFKPVLAFFVLVLLSLGAAAAVGMTLHHFDSAVNVAGWIVGLGFAFFVVSVAITLTRFSTS